MKVTFVYRYLTLGGVESVLASRLRALPRLGVHPTLWFLEDGPGRCLWETRPPEVSVGSVGALQVHLEEEAPDVVSVIDTPEALSPAASATCRPRLLLEVHTPYPENRLYLRQPDSRLATAVLVPSEHQKQIVGREMPVSPRIIVVPNPLGEGFEAPLQTVEAQGAPPIVCWVGRLDRLKNWRGFLSMLKRVFRQVPQAEAWVVGAGSVDEEADFMRSCEDPALGGRVRWLRGVRPAEMPRLLDGVRSTGGVVVSTSRAESFGMAVAEAMARGCAVVVPRERPFTEFIDSDVSGVSYPSGSTTAACKLVTRMVTDAVLRSALGGEARRRILSGYGTESSIQALLQAIQTVASGSAIAPTGGASPSGRASALSLGHGSWHRPTRGDKGAPHPSSSILRDSDLDRDHRESLFAGYYASGFWPGPGSSLEYTAALRRELPALLRRLGANRVLDAPCGDFVWFSEMERDPELDYVGGDIIPELVASNQRRFGAPGTRFQVIDITQDPLPLADVWLCRDCLIHLSNRQVHDSIRNFVRSGIRFWLTTRYPDCEANANIETGGFRPINLELPPFNLPPPEEAIEDWIPGHPARQLALWRRDTLLRSIT